MKRAVVLLITVGFIAFLSAMIASSLFIFQKAYAHIEAIQLSTQTSIVFQDILKHLSEQKKEIDEMYKLEQFTARHFPLYSKNGSFGVKVTVTSKSNRINLNNLLSEGEHASLLSDLLKNLSKEHKLANPDLLVNLLLDSVDEDLLERESGSEIAGYDGDFKNGKIENSRHFEKIMARYMVLTGDKRVKEIPWEKLFVFGGTAQSNSIDCDYMSRELAMALGLVFDQEQKMSCQNLQREANKKILEKYRIEKYKHESDYIAEVTMSLEVNKRDRNILKFDYALKSGRVGHVEKYF